MRFCFIAVCSQAESYLGQTRQAAISDRCDGLRTSSSKELNISDVRKQHRNTL